MRRSIWCTGAVLIGSAAWLYLAATYVCDYPNSYLGQCAEVAYRLGGEVNPGYRLSHAFAMRVRHGVDQVLGDHGYVRVDTIKPCRSCEPCVPSLEAIAASAPVGMIEALPVPPFEVAPGVDVVDSNKMADGSEECTSGVITVGAFAPPVGEDGDPAPKTMPPLPPDEKADEAPATMPYETDDDDADGNRLIEFWKTQQKIRNEAEPKVEPKTMKPEEESEPPLDSNAGESPDSGNSMYHMPASHYSPNCPSCPGTVTCPYTGRTYSTDPNDDEKDPVVPTPTMKKKKKKKKDDAGNMPSKMSRLIEMEKGTEDVPIHPEVDTMEYRGSDGKRGEFDPQPE